jgi:putative ABC transport system permease protein
MNLSRNVLLSCEILMAHKLRTLLSMLGIAVGVGAVVLMVAGGKGAEKHILDRIRGLGTNLIIVNAGQTRLIAGRRRQFGTVTTLTPDDAQAIVRNCSATKLAAPTVTKKLATKFESEMANTAVVGTTADAFRIRNIEIAVGRVFSEEEVRGRRRVAVLGQTAAQNLFGEMDPLNLSFRIGRVPFEVIGITVPKGTDANGVDQDDMIIIPLDTAMRRLLNITYVDSFYVQARDGNALADAETQIREVLRERHRLRTAPDDFSIQNQATLLQAEQETSQAMTLLIGGVAGISLAVGGVGILAVMLISVRERIHEIGLRRAVGATRGDIRTQFLIESGLLSGMGGLMGVLLGLVSALLVAKMGYWSVLISWPAIVVALVFSIGLGIIFGSYPAHRAAQLDPITALRSE